MVIVVIFAWSGHSARAAHSWHVVAAAAASDVAAAASDVAAATSSAADTVWGWEEGSDHWGRR